MKVYGFENTAPRPDNGRKPSKSVNPQSVEVNRVKISETNCRLELNSLESPGFGRRRSEDSMGIRRRPREAEYRLNFISGTVLRPGGESRESKLGEIRKNIADGYYNSPEFIEKLADTLINKLHLKKAAN